jgi:hypothetical protein
MPKIPSKQSVKNMSLAQLNKLMKKLSKKSQKGRPKRKPTQGILNWVRDAKIVARDYNIRYNMRDPDFVMAVKQYQNGG